MSRALGLLLASAMTVAGIGFGAWLAVLAVQSLVPGVGFAAIPVLAAFELVFGGAGLLLGYRTYYWVSNHNRGPTRGR